MTLPCDSSPCQNGGVCGNTRNYYNNYYNRQSLGYHCNCTNGYAGRNCTLRDDPNGIRYLEVCPTRTVTLLPGSSGFIQSPNYPEKYPNARRCNLTLEYSDHHNISLRTESMNIESHSTCTYDHVQVVSGGHWSNRLNTGRLCGQAHFRQSFLSNSFSIIFKSDGSVNLSGFQFHFASVQGNNDMAMDDKAEIGAEMEADVVADELQMDMEMDLEKQIDEYFGDY